MEDPKTPSSDQLLAHGNALRSIVRSLIGDEHADDVVQESYLATLRRQAPIADLGAWMRGVARKLSFRQLRGEERRRHRETIAASREENTGEQAEVLSQVADEVRELREPFRTAIVMRYWQGLPPRTISKELGVPLNTVRSRLQTGLAELRRRLDQRNGGRAAWAGPLMLFGAQPASAGVGGIGLAVLGGVGVCGLIVGMFALDLHPWRADLVEAVEVKSDLEDIGDDAAREPDTPQALNRSSVDAQFIGGLCVAYGTRVPLKECRVRFVTVKDGADRRGKWTPCDDQGRFRIRPPAGSRTPSWLEVAGPGRANVRVELDAGKATVGEVQLPQGVRIVGTVRDEGGVPITDLRMRVIRRSQMLRRADVGHPVADGWGIYEGSFYAGLTGSGSQSYPITEAYAKTDRHGEFTLPGVWLGPALTDDDACKIENLDRCKFVSLRRLDQGDVLRFDIVMRRPVALPKIVGTLTTKDGTPVPGAKVVATSRDWSKVVAHTDARGRFELIKSKGADEADHVTLTMPAIVGAGFATIDPGHSFTWGDVNVRLRAKAPVPLSLHTEDRDLDLRAWRLRCVTFVDEDCEIGGPYTAEPAGSTTRSTATFLVASGVSHLALVAGEDTSIYLGFHRCDKGVHELRVARHRVEFRVQDENSQPIHSVYLDMMGNFADREDAPFLREACDNMLQPLTPVLRTNRQGECVIEFGFAPADCAVRFSLGRETVLLESIPKARPVIVSMPRSGR